MKPKSTRASCYPAGTCKPLQYAAYALIAVGALLLLCCIPGWAWLALLGAALLAAGIALLKFCHTWR